MTMRFEQQLRLARVHDGQDGNGRPIVIRPFVDPRTREQLLDYLESAPVVLSASGFAADAFVPDDLDVPLTYRTDGTWVWSDAVPHYLRKHGLPPEPDLVQHVVSRNFRTPTPSESQHAAARVMLGVPAEPAGPKRASKPVRIFDSSKRRTWRTVAVVGSALATVIGVVVASMAMTDDSTEPVAMTTIPVSGGGDGMMAIDPKGHVAYVANASDGTVTAFDTATHNVTATIEVGNRPLGVAVDSAIGKAYVVTTDNSVRNRSALTIIDTVTNTVTDTIAIDKNSWGVAVDTGTHEVFVVDVSQTGSKEANESYVTIIDPVKKVVTGTITAGSGAMRIALNSWTHTAYVASYSDASVKVIDTVTRAVVASIPIPGMPQGIAVDEAGHTLFVTTGTRIVTVDTLTHAVTGEIPVDCDAGEVVMDPTARKVYAACEDASRVVEVDAASRTVTEPIDVKVGRGLAVDPTTRIVYARSGSVVNVIQR